MGGRRPKAPALRLVQGNPGKRKANASQLIAPVLDVEVPAPPVLTGRSLAEWQRLTPILRDANLLSTLDVSALAGLCIATAQLHDAQDALVSGGATYTTETGYVRPSPHMGIAHRCIAIIARLSIEFGLTPAARTRVSVDTKTEEDEFEKYLRQGKT